MENVCTADGKNATTIRFFTTETSSSKLLSALQAELVNLDSIYTSYKPLTLKATQMLRREPTFDGMSTFNRCAKRSLLPFLGDALSWLTRTARTKDVRSIKNRVNQLIMMQHQQQETLVHFISILNVTRYMTQVNRQHINNGNGCSRKDK